MKLHQREEKVKLQINSSTLKRRFWEDKRLILDKRRYLRTKISPMESKWKKSSMWWISILCGLWIESILADAALDESSIGMLNKGRLYMNEFSPNIGFRDKD